MKVSYAKGLNISKNLRAKLTTAEIEIQSDFAQPISNLYVYLILNLLSWKL